MVISYIQTIRYPLESITTVFICILTFIMCFKLYIIFKISYFICVRWFKNFCNISIYIYIYIYIYPSSCTSLKIATWEAETCNRYTVCVIYLRTPRCIFVLISYLVKSCVFGIIIIIICWHNSLQNDYRYGTGNIKLYPTTNYK